MIQYESVQFFQFLNVKPPPHKRKAPPHKRKAPLLKTFLRRFWVPSSFSVG